MNFDAGTQHHDPSAARQRLRFPTVEQRRARVAETFTKGQYDHPDARYLTPTDNFGTQTEVQGSREIAVGEGDAVYEPPERVKELDLQLPNPQDFPILSIGQLIEAEQRTLQLIRLLEAHIIRATEEDNEARRIDRVRRGELDNKRRTKLISTEEYLARMGEKVELRVRRSHQDPEGKKLPSAWVHDKIGDIPTSPSPHRVRTVPRKTMEEIGKKEADPDDEDEDGDVPPPPPDDDDGSDRLNASSQRLNLSGTATSIEAMLINAPTDKTPATKKLGVERINVAEFVSSVQPGVPVIEPKKKDRKTRWETFDPFAKNRNNKENTGTSSA